MGKRKSALLFAIAILFTTIGSAGSLAQAQIPTATGVEATRGAVTGTPSVTGFSPGQGTAGTQVAITGTDFSAATDVQFSGTSAAFTITDDSDITATVPSGAATGPISVVTPDGTATSTDSFTVTGTPSVTGFTPSHGVEGTQVLVTGTDFTNASDVQFSGVSAAFTITDDSDITATVPSGAATGPISVVTPDGTATSTDSFNVLPPQNVVLILTDDQVVNTLQWMPNVESDLVSHGVTFSNAFDNNPLCCPTRSTIMTGLTSGHNGVWSNGPGMGYTGPPAGGFTGFVYHNDQNHQIFGWLHNAGYQTALIGKFLNGYLGGTGRTSDVRWVMPGVDDWYAMLLNGTQPTKTGCQIGGYYGVCYSDNGVLTAPDSGYSNDRVTSQALSFIDSADPSKPLFLYFAPRAPHQPSTPEPTYANACPSSLVGNVNADPTYNQLIAHAPAYMASRSAIKTKQAKTLQTHWQNDCNTLLSVDNSVHQIVQALSDTGRLQNTLIMFASDNGYIFGQHRWSGKIVPYENSIRVPVVVRDDAVIPADQQGTTVTDQITSLDYTETFLEAAQVSEPGLDGQSLFPLLGGAGTWTTQDPLLIEHGNGITEFAEPKAPSYCGVRSAGYMYAQYSTGEEELYDLSADPGETTNVASDSSYTGVLDTLRQQTHQLCDPTPPGFRWSH
jgi:N-acetylglucosamine-6-sulfatase